MFSDGFGDSFAELLAGHVGGGFTYKVGNDTHGIAAVGVETAVAVGRLGGGAIDDGNEIIGDDDSVLAFLLLVFRDEVLFDDGHGTVGEYLYTRRNIGAGPVSPADSWRW